MESNELLQWKNIEGDGLNMNYAYNYLTKEKADELFNKLENDLQYFSGDLTKVRVFGKWQNIPRQQVAFGDPGLSYKFSGLTVPALAWPEVLATVRDNISETLGFDYNFVLVNRYRNGNDHIGEHRDDEAELDVDAGIVSISLGQVRDFVLRHRDHKRRIRKVDPVKIALDHGSLLHMKKPTNTYWYHSLPVKKSATGVRINLTFRKVNVKRVEIKN